MGDRRVAFKSAKARADGTAVELVAPYTFVPLIPPLPSCFGDCAPSHGRPEPDGMCGRLRVAWSFETPVLVGGSDKGDKSKRRGEEKAGEKLARFMTDARGRPIIPGSTIRGLLRNVIEIATGSRMDIVDRDAHFAVRDSEDEYWKQFAPTDKDRAMSFGWLVRDDHEAGFTNSTYGGWTLHIVSKAWQIETAAILQLIPNAPDLATFEGWTVNEKYEALTRGPGAKIAYEVKDKPGAKVYEEPSRAVPGKNGRPGWIVLTGVDPNRDSTKPKRYATVFGEDIAGKFPLPPDLVRRFVRIHATTPGAERKEGAWAFWSDACREGSLPAGTGGSRMPGIPVFIVHSMKGRGEQSSGGRHGDALKFDHKQRNAELARILGPLKAQPSGSPRRQSKPPQELYLGLSRFVKVPHRHGMNDKLWQQGHGEDGRLDFARALFGQVPSEKLDRPETSSTKISAGALKGRVFFAEAALDHVPGDDRYRREIGTTMSPRASFWPYYLRPSQAQHGKASAAYDWSNEHAELAGWKRYPVRPSDPARFPWDDRTEAWKGRPLDPAAVLPTESAMSFLVPPRNGALVFTGEIRFHNLRPAELGALLWALTWGAADGLDGHTVPHRHLVGRGKAQGYGRCAAQVLDLVVEPNDASAPKSATTYVESFREHVKKAYFEKEPGATAAGFEDLPMVRQLLAIADPRVAAGLEDRLVYPRHPFVPQGARETVLRRGRSALPEDSASLDGYMKVKEAAKDAAKAHRPPVHLPPYPDTTDT
ncbi:hypothetical protein A33M_1378 [Rhodovulum sp. PH10]|uniref:TIGR03986 family type III CRISPR-associated RAMP protein n=1 Tax=Rhodovulum sp. PH10 TaxID=1187851 RepID=UPI00027C241D|nr:TIGR03986 family CRISPR-associated RAMP protein [Rhodovulum sp. PH10]EJW09405.1 hypothetical protein A33M_1378 [Rhodovulum sp. PH10]